MPKNLGPRDLVHDKVYSAWTAASGRISRPVGRPSIKPFRREHRVLRRLHDCRPIRPIGKKYNPFYPQQIVAVAAGEAAERPGEVETGDLAAETDSKGVNAMRVDRNRFG